MATIIETPETCISLKQLRKRVLRITQVELGAQVGLSDSEISNIETGRVPAQEHVPALARAYGVSEAEFWRLHRREKSGGSNGESANSGVAGEVAVHRAGVSDAVSVSRVGFEAETVRSGEARGRGAVANQ